MNTTPPRKPLGTILYRGPSLLDGTPIIAIATHNQRNRNRKTGPMQQTWILVDPTLCKPQAATKDGSDVAICGDCPHRHYLGGACYVLPHQAPRSIASAYLHGRYSEWDGQPLGGAVRLGAYGDPAAVPTDVWARAIGGRDNPHTGYTRQWRRDRAQSLRPYCMASVCNDAEQTEAQALGWRTFRIVAPADAEPRTGYRCPAETGVQCSKCLQCDGARPGDTRKSPWILGHGTKANRLNVLI